MSMERKYLQRFITQLNGMIATLDQAIVLGGRTQKEREACELLKDARLRLLEDLETRGPARSSNKNTDALPEYTLDEERLRRSLTELEQALPGLLKYPSKILESESTIYGAALALLVESVHPALADPAREFLTTFHAHLERRRRVTTWDQNGQWFAGRVQARPAERTWLCRTTKAKKERFYMSETEWEATYGPPVTDAPYIVGQTLFYDDCGTVENGEILSIACQPELLYIVSPATDAFPTPVWPQQVIAAL
jgi:hypothetical protein